MKNFRFSLVAMLGLALLSLNLETFAQIVPLPPPTPPQHVLTPPPAPGTAPGLDTFLAWDADRKEVSVPNGTPQAQFTFNLTNISSEVVTISSVSTSCGCTVAQLPAVPWKIAPGTNGQISATMNLAGKSGTVPKTLTVYSDKGTKALIVETTILQANAAAQPMTRMDREANQKLAIADRQGVFKNDCARCHAEPAKGKTGKELFTAACGVCHEAEHRATMVADLHALPYPTTPEIWRNWITHGKPGSLMPAFAISEGGILTDEQISSLVNYLVAAIPSKPFPAKTAQLTKPN